MRDLPYEIPRRLVEGLQIWVVYGCESSANEPREERKYEKKTRRSRYRNSYLLDSSLNLISSNIQKASLIVTPAAVNPEPSTLLLFATGLIMLRRGRKRQIPSSTMGLKD